MKKTLILLLAAGLAACGAPSGDKKAAAPELDKPAPPLALEKIVSGDKVADWADLKGRAVVLEFWAPWCGPCVENVPHLNELAEKFKGKPVAFVSVSRDGRDEVEKFLEKQEMKGTVAAEAGLAFRNYKVRGIPHTVLVDKDGVIRGFSYPSYVTPETVEALLAGSKTIPGVFVEKKEKKS